MSCCCKKTLDNNKPCVEIDNNTLNISCCTKKESHNETVQLSPYTKRKNNTPKNYIIEI